MPLAVVPRAELLVRQDAYFRCAEVTDGFALSAVNIKRLYGPMYFSQYGSAPSRGLTFLGQSGRVIARFTWAGDIILSGILVLENSITFSARGFYWKNASNEYVLWLDEDGNLHTVTQVILNSALVLEKTAGSFQWDTANSFALNTAIAPMVVFVGSNAALPIMQVMSTASDCVLKIGQTGLIEMKNGTLSSDVGVTLSDTVYGSTKF